MALPLLPIGMDLLEVLAATLVGGSAFKGIYDAVAGLLAKRSAKEIVSRHIAEIRSIIDSNQNMSDADKREIWRRLVVQYIQSMKKNEKDIVIDGLNQSNRSGADRYLESLISERSEKS